MFKKVENFPHTLLQDVEIIKYTKEYIDEANNIKIASYKRSNVHALYILELNKGIIISCK